MALGRDGGGIPTGGGVGSDDSSGDDDDDDGGGSSDYGGDTGSSDDTQDTGTSGSGETESTNRLKDELATQTGAQDSADSDDDDGGGSSDYGGDTGSSDDTQDTGTSGSGETKSTNRLKDELATQTGAQDSADSDDDDGTRTIEGSPPDDPDYGGGTGLTDSTQDQNPPTTADGPFEKDAGVEPTRPDPADDDAILDAITEQVASDTDYAASQYTVTDFRENDTGELVPVVELRGEQPGDVDGVPDEYRNQFREEAVSNTATADTDEASIVVTDDGDVNVEFGESVAERRRRNVAATQFDAEFPEVDIGPQDVRPTGDGAVGLTEDAIAEVARQQQSDAVASPGVIDQDMDRSAQQGAAEQASQRDISDIQPENEPGAVTSAIGGAASALGNSPVGSVVDRATDPLFGDSRGDGVVGEIDSVLADVESGWENTFDYELRGAQPRSPAPGVMISPQIGRDLTDRTAELVNPGAIGRDIITVADSAVRGGAFLAERGPEGAQIGKELAVTGARAAPGAAQTAAREAVRNPRDTALTGGALVATFGAGAAASSVARGSAGLAARGTRSVAGRADDIVDVTGRTRRASDSINDAIGRAPDVSVRRDPTSGPLDVDPMLQRQVSDAVQNVNIGGRVSAGVDRIREINTPSGDGTAEVFGRPQGAANAAGSSARRVAEAASDIEDRLRELNRPDGDSSSDVFGRPTRANRPPTVSGDSRVRSALSDASDWFGEFNQPASTGTAGVFGRPLRGSIPSARRGEGVLGRLNRANQGDLGSSDVFGRPMTNDFDLGLDRFSVSRRGGTAEVFGRPERTAAVADRVSQFERPDVLGGLRSLAPDRSVRELASDASDVTLRVGPVRPARTEIDASDLDIEFDRFDDEIDFGLDDAGSAGGRTDFDADVDVGGGGGSGSAQLSAMRTSRRADSDVDLDDRVRSRERDRSGPNVERNDIFAGLGSITGFGNMGEISPATPLGEENVGDVSVPTESSTGVGSDFGFGVGEFTGLDTSGGTVPKIGTDIDTTVDTTPTTDLNLDSGLTGSASSRFSFRPRTPDVPELGEPDRADDSDVGEFTFDDDVFETGVGDPDEVLDNLF